MNEHDKARMGNIILGVLAAVELTPEQTAIAQEYLDALGLNLTLLSDGEDAGPNTPPLRIVP